MNLVGIKNTAAKSFAAILLITGIMAMMSLMLQWYVALALLILCAELIFFFWQKLHRSTKRKISGNFFFILTAVAAVVIVLFVAYLLLHIFLLGKSHLTLDFLLSEPKEGLTEGGIFPAIIGTAMLVIIMSIAGVPIGTITAIYLTEYASEKSVIARFIRFAVNTLAGVPAIVFGLFGLGFFIGTVGKQMDNFEFEKRLEKMNILFHSGNSPFSRDGTARGDEIKNVFASSDESYWSEQIVLTKILAEMHGDEAITIAQTLTFYQERQRPHWGQPSLLWAALTMALLTLPVVIVSVEEAIKTVPRELREASLALGATKWGTIRRVVIPGSITGILTGGILAVSRGAGEVAPILFTGAAYYLPELPSSLSSQFMELGYHIYILTTQSTNVEATKPLQYATTFILLMLTFALNFSAIFLRSRIRARQVQHGQ